MAAPTQPDVEPVPMSSPAAAESPAAIYRRCLADNHLLLSREQRRHHWLGYAKITDFLLGVALAVFTLTAQSHALLLLIPVAIFIVLLVAHDRVLRRLQKLERVADFYARGLARLDDHWAGTGETGDRFLSPTHPYARDLDLFGAGGLFELLCTARTRAGEATLADWLLNRASPETVLARQQAVADLRPRLPLREQLFAAGETVRLGVHPDALTAWGEAAPAFHSPWLLWILGVLGVAWMGVAAVWLVHLIDLLARGYGYDVAVSGPLWWGLLVLSLVNYGISRTLKVRVDAAADAIEHAAGDLRLLVEVLALLEREPYAAPRLRDLRASLNTHNIPASVAVARLERIADWLEGRHNLFTRIAMGLAFYDTQFTLAAERWQRRFGPAIRGWLAAVGEFEALSSLAGYAFEHPSDPFPTFAAESPCFETRGLGHPLLPVSQAVGNDLSLGSGTPQLLIVSGPNMAGKSTFLRAIGLNAALAQAGAPVRAASLRMSPLAVGASICILDSLQGGVSRFYAEIQRLKLLSDLADGPTPLLFLLDELLSGTNSHDRLEGTRHVVTALVRRGAIGLVTTHDLALTAIPEALNATMPGAASNTHFEDSMEDGRLHFDYRLKPGIVQTSNALKLMQSIGLDIPTA
ncbi:MAG: mismatch repair protein [Acidobacteriaceae bacterium]